VGGVSAGGGLAMALTLATRDRSGPQISALVMDTPYVSRTAGNSMTNNKVNKIWRALFEGGIWNP
jgi:acetyl esterase/lipase